MDPDDGDHPGKAFAYGDVVAKTSVGMNYVHAEAEGTRCAAAVSGGRGDGAYGVVSGQGAYLIINKVDRPVKKKKPKKPVLKDDSATLTTPNETEARDVTGGQRQVIDSASYFGTVIQGRPALDANKQTPDTNVGPVLGNTWQAAVCERDRTPSDLNGVNTSTDHPDGTVETQQRRSVLPLSNWVVVCGGGAVAIAIISAIVFFIVEPTPTPPIIQGEHRSSRFLIISYSSYKCNMCCCSVPIDCQMFLFSHLVWPVIWI